MCASSDFHNQGGEGARLSGQIQALKPIMSKTLDGVASIISAIIGVKCAFEGMDIAPANANEVSALLGATDVVFGTTIPLDDNRPAFLVLDSSVVKKIANVITGQPMDEDLDRPVGEMRLTASGEIVGQILGRVGIGFTGNEDTQVTPVVAHENNLAQAITTVIPSALIITTANFSVDQSERWNVRIIIGASSTGNFLSGQEEMKGAGISSDNNFDPMRDLTIPEPEVTYRPAQFAELPDRKVTHSPRNIDVLLDVPLNVTVLLGRARVPIKQVLEYGQGSLISLDKLAGEPVDLLINGKYFAKGEVVVIDENFGVRISSILTPEERLQQLTLNQPD